MVDLSDKCAMLVAIRERLERVYGDRLRDVVLFGSVARDEQTSDSDIDVLVVLDGPIEYGRELRRSIEALYPLSLEWKRPISAKPAALEDYASDDWPLYESVKRDGIRA